VNAFQVLFSFKQLKQSPHPTIFPAYMRQEQGSRVDIINASLMDNDPDKKNKRQQSVIAGSRRLPVGMALAKELAGELTSCVPRPDDAATAPACRHGSESGICDFSFSAVRMRARHAGADAPPFTGPIPHAASGGLPGNFPGHGLISAGTTSPERPWPRRVRRSFTRRSVPEAASFTHIQAAAKLNKRGALNGVR